MIEFLEEKFVYSRYRNRFLQFIVLFFSFNLYLTSPQIAHGVEPDGKLYHENDEIRNNYYVEKAQQLEEKLKHVEEGEAHQMLLLQQQLLTKLRKLPGASEQAEASESTAEDGFGDILGSGSLGWVDVEKYIKKYVEVLNEKSISSNNLRGTKEKLQTLRSRLIALAENAREVPLLQLQFAYQVRKLANQRQVDRQLQQRLDLAEKGYAKLFEYAEIEEIEVIQQKELVEHSKRQLDKLDDEKILASASDEVKAEQLESQIADYLGQELGDDEKKQMHYGQLQLLEHKVDILAKESNLLDARMAHVLGGLKLQWLSLLRDSQDIFAIAENTTSLEKEAARIKKQAGKYQVRKYSFEKEISSLRGGNASIGPKSRELVEELDTRLGEIFTQLSGVYQQGETVENQGSLLRQGIETKKSSLTTMVISTREATFNVYEKVMAVLKYQIVSYSGMSVTPLLLLQVATLLVFGLIVNRLYGHVVLRMGRSRNWSERTIQLVHAVGKYPFTIIVALIILSVVGINTSSLALVAGALSVGIGFGMQAIVNNLVSGIILLFDKSIRPGDFISLGEDRGPGGFRGNVVQMNFRATVLRTNDNINIIIPNADLMASQVVNWTYSDEKIRFRVPFSVAYGTDIERVKSIVKEAIMELPLVLEHPKTQIWMVEHGDNALSFIAAVWVEGQNARRPSYTFDVVLSAIYKALNEQGIEIPFPQLDLRIKEADYLPETLLKGMRN